MPNSPCRVTVGHICKIASSTTTPLNCILFNAPTPIQITAAGYTDFATTTAKTITPASDGQSFQIPIDTPGMFSVSVTVNESKGMILTIAEDCPSHTALFWVSPQTNIGSFTLEVTA